MDFQDKPVTVTPIAEGYRVAILGSVHTNVAWLERELNSIVTHKPKQIEIDLAKTEFISSTGIGVLVGFRNAVTKNGGSVRIVAIQKAVLGVFKFSYLDKMFKVTPAEVIPAAQQP